MIATKAFFKLLGNRELSQSFQKLLDGQLVPKIEQQTPKASVPKAGSPIATESKTPIRNDAVSLLAALQRESRFLDIVQEPLEQYSDAQVGAAARDVLKGSGAVIQRMFGLMPLTESEEGSQLETPLQLDPAEYRLVGRVEGSPPFRGRVTHHGWRATRCDLPKWTGSASASMIVAPIELEIE